MGQYFLNILIALDRMINTIIGGNPVETLSSVAYRKNRDKQPWGFMMGVINALFFNSMHCENAFHYDRSQSSTLAS